MNVIIPSYKRSHDLKGKDYFLMAKYCVPESQKKEYIEAVGENRVITLPDSEDGDIIKKRNWILKNIPRLSPIHETVIVSILKDRGEWKPK